MTGVLIAFGILFLSVLIFLGYSIFVYCRGEIETHKAAGAGQSTQDETDNEIE